MLMPSRLDLFSSLLIYSYGLSRVTPIQNFTDDFTWIKGNHTIQFGGNVRIIRNKRVDDGASFGAASTNPFFYSGSGRSLLAAARPSVWCFDE